MSIEAMKQALSDMHRQGYEDGYRAGFIAAMDSIKTTQPAQPKEPLDMPLPCDVTVGHVTIRKNVSLRTLVGRMQILHDMAQQAPVHCERCAEMGYEQPKRAALVF